MEKVQVAFGESSRRGEIYPGVRIALTTEYVTPITVIAILWAGCTPDVLKDRIDEAVKVVRDAMNRIIRSKTMPKSATDGTLGAIECTVSETRDPGLMQVFYPSYFKGKLSNEDFDAVRKVLEALFGKDNVVHDLPGATQF
jgi:hypothetical protein